MTPYVFVANNAVKQIDYLGLCEITEGAGGIYIVQVYTNEIVWWITHSNKRNPIFIPPPLYYGFFANGAFGAAGDLGCEAAFNNQRTAKVPGFLIPGAPTTGEAFEGPVNPWKGDQTAYDAAVKEMSDGTVSLVNKWLAAGGSCSNTTVTVTYRTWRLFWART